MKLSRAKKLTVGLSDEQTRWTYEVGNLQQIAKLIEGNSVIAAGTVAYSGSFTAKYRISLEGQWEQHILAKPLLPITAKVSMRSFLGVPVVIQGWNIAGLPKDDTSTENGIIIFKSKRWPLMIDPQTQANRFIKNMGKEHSEGLDVIKITEPTLMRTI